MTFTTKEHLISALITFLATFATSFGATLTTVDPEHITQTSIVALVISAINVAIRA
jgi:hypothetical protein